MSLSYSRAAASRWLLHSGIQETSGGFARYYDAEARKNRPVSTEISGYAASALVYLFRISGDEEYLDGARRTARFLVNAWDRESGLFPFEYPSPSAESEHLAYFFDSGIVIRGLVAVWRETGDGELLGIARAAAHDMIRSFRGAEDFHPIVVLPEKTPLPRSAKWSRAPGCYQLKAAMAWWDVSEVTGDAALRHAYLEMVEYAMKHHACFLREAAGAYDATDRLHAYAYFLEGLLPAMERPECRAVLDAGIAAMDRGIRETENVFVRSDVLAQWLRAWRFLNKGAGGEDRRRYIDDLAAFQDASGGFWFGRRDGRISPQLNPVSTAFAVQALEMEADGKPPCLRMLI